MGFPLTAIGVLLLAGQLAVVPSDLENAYDALKVAVSKKDAAQVKKLAAEVAALVQKTAAEPAPSDPDEKASWQKHIAWAKEVGTYSEYALFATAVQSEPATTVDLLGALEHQNPKSKYLADAYGQYLAALGRSGAGAKAPAIAEKGLANFPDNEDLLMVMTDHAAARKQTDRSAAYAERLIAAFGRKAKPEGVSAADWDRKKATMLGRAHWIAGVTHAEKQQYGDADKDLRAALPAIQGNQSMLGPALFYLGICNYQIGKLTLNKARVVEAASFSEKAAAIQGPYQQQAWNNAAAMKKEAAAMR
jgi:hypothetical protein